jgi:hypothetical protein
VGRHLWYGLSGSYKMLGFRRATSADGVLGQLLMARIIDQTSDPDILVKPAHVVVPTFG